MHPTNMCIGGSFEWLVYKFSEPKYMNGVVFETSGRTSVNRKERKIRVLLKLFTEIQKKKKLLNQIEWTLREP